MLSTPKSWISLLASAIFFCSMSSSARGSSMVYGSSGGFS
jgi:hypothetical protein